MQALTPSQVKALTDIGFKIAEGVIWGLMAWGGKAVMTSVRSIRPGIIADIEKYFDRRMDAHEETDSHRFELHEQRFNRIEELFEDIPGSPAPVVRKKSAH